MKFLRTTERVRVGECGVVRRGLAAFTMIEIALSLAIMGFALVAIVGVLPLGMNVQKSNRDDTIINQEGVFYLEAIRSGATALTDLTNYVEEVMLSGTNRNGVPLATNAFRGTTNTEFVAGLLMTPKGWPRQAMYVTNVTAKVRSRTGSLQAQSASKDARDFAFSYLLTSEIIPYPTFATNSLLSSNLYEIRLTLRWPVFGRAGAWRAGGNHQSFRTMVNGTVRSNWWNQENQPMYFLTPATRQ